MPLLTQEEFRSNDRANQCPYCQSEDYEPGSIDVAGAQVVQHRRCNACDATWLAIFRIAGYVRCGFEDEDFDDLCLVECVDRDAATPHSATTCTVDLCVQDATCPRWLHCRRHACTCSAD